MSKFGLVESFQIDNGELDEFTKQQCYVFGWETANLSWRADVEPGEWSSMVNRPNWPRVEDALLKRGRTFSTEIHSDGWMAVHVDERIDWNRKG